jgi:hypothetical protein
MSYAERKEVEFDDHESLVELLMDVDSRVNDLKPVLDGLDGKINPASDDFPLAPGEVGVILLPSDPPSTACILQNDTGDWMLQCPCGGIFVYNLSTGTPTIP